MPTSGAGDFSPDGKRLAYSPLFRDFRTWKRYEGGWAQDLYVYDLATNDAKPFAATMRTERDPMWIGDAIYFASDRDGTLNLYSYDLATEAVAKLTTSTTWDVRWPSSDDVSRIVYELDGELHVFDVRAKADQALSIFVPNDGVAMRPVAALAPRRTIEDFDLSPKGERALVVARGDVFTVPIEKGPTRNLTNTSNAHDKWARWSPDGKRIAFLSDRSGEDEVWLVDQAGGKPEQVTSGGQAMRYAPGVVGGGNPPRLLRQGRPALRRHAGRQEARPGRGRPPRHDPRLHLVAEGGLPGLLDERPLRHALAARLERGATASCTG